MSHTILLIDDKSDNLKLLKSVLESKGFAVHQAPNAKFACSLLSKNVGRYALALVDYHMPDINGDEATRMLHQIDRDLQVITISGDDSDEVADQCLKAGSFIFLPRGITAPRLVSIVESYCKRFDNKNSFSNKNLPISESEKFISTFGMIGASKSTVNTCELVDRYAIRDQSVFITGENGTGKERVAKAVHEKSAVKTGPFVAVNCGAISEALIESELFGHTKGAFTGALREKPGFFKEANGGTIFLDEIGDMPIHLQVKLLRVLQEREITPVGASTPIKINVRVIAATNVNLVRAIKQKNFREDLYYRLNVLSIDLDPLRKRVEDIEPLIRHFVTRWEENTGEAKNFHSDVIGAMKAHSWPGNVRELENMVNRMLAKTEGNDIEVRHIDESLKIMRTEPQTINLADRLNHLKAEFQHNEREILIEIVRESGSMSKAARLLQIAKSTLHDKLKGLGVQINVLIEEKP